MANGTEIMRLWDNPNNRILPAISFDMGAGRSTAKITMLPMLYEGMAWRPKRVYRAGDKLSVGDMFPANCYWLCVMGGKSGPQEPDWGQAVQANQAPLLAAQYRSILAVAVVDNGNGTVTLTVSGHAFVAGDQVTVAGTVNYNGAYTLPSQAGAGLDQLIITATYVAETPTGGQVYLTGGQAVDLGGGLITLPCPGHGRTAGERVYVTGSDYDGEYVLPAQSAGDADHLVIEATYSAGLINGGVVSWPVLDPPTGGAAWRWVSGVLTSAGQPTGRIIAKDAGTGVLEAGALISPCDTNDEEQTGRPGDCRREAWRGSVWGGDLRGGG